MILITPSDRFAIFGATGMAGSAISRALYRSCYYQQLKPSRQELDLLNPMAVQQWFGEHQPSVVVLTAAKVGGIHANATYPADLLENLKIQTRNRNSLVQGFGVCYSLAVAASTSDNQSRGGTTLGRWSHNEWYASQDLWDQVAKHCVYNTDLMRSA